MLISSLDVNKGITNQSYPLVFLFKSIKKTAYLPTE